MRSPAEKPPFSALCIQVLILRSTKSLLAGWGIHIDSCIQGENQNPLEGDSTHCKT